MLGSGSRPLLKVSLAGFPSPQDVRYLLPEDGAYGKNYNFSLS
jgi:hypothetical protein